MIKSFTGKYKFLSNFYPHQMRWRGLSYPSIEHAFQASKVLSNKERQKFTMGTPGHAKKLGQQVKLREDWEEVKVGVMKALLHIKFAKSPLRGELLATEHEVLVEDNDWGDTFWGTCNGEGKNVLGKLLMEVRSEIR